jgi:hypothetical protein
MHLFDGALHEGSQTQVRDRGMQQRGIEVDCKVMLPSPPVKVEHATLFEIPDDAPDLPFRMSNGAGDVFRSAVRAKGDIEQDVSLW